MAETKGFEPGFCNIFSENSTGDKVCSVLQLVSFLKGAFRAADFEMVEQILQSREENLEAREENLRVKMEKFSKWQSEESAVREQVEALLKKNSDIEKQNLELETKFKNLGLQSWDMAKKLEGWQKRCGKLEERCLKAEDDSRILGLKECQAREETKTLSKELKRKEEDVKKRYVEFETKLAGSDSAKLVAQVELEKCRKRCNELKERSITAEADSKVLAFKERQAREDIEDLLDQLKRKEEDANKQCRELDAKLESMLDVQEELEKCKRTCSDLEKQITSLEEDYKVVCDRERAAQERTRVLSEEVKMVLEVRDQYMHLKEKVGELDCSKKLIDSELEVYMRKCNELQLQILRLEEDYRILSTREQQAQEKIVGLKELLNDVSIEDQGNQESRKKLGGKCIERGGKKLDENGTDSAFGVQNLENRNAPSAHVELEQESLGFNEIISKNTYVNSATYPYTSIDDIKDQKKDGSFAAKIEPQKGCRSQVRKQLFNPTQSTHPIYSNNGSCDGNGAHGVAKSMLDVIEISDSDNETGISPSENVILLEPTSGEALDDVEEAPSKKILKKKHLDVTGEVMIERDASSCDEDFLPLLIPKRRRVTRVISDSDGEEHEDGPIASRKMKKPHYVGDNLKDNLVSYETKIHCLHGGSVEAKAHTSVVIAREPWTGI